MKKKILKETIIISVIILTLILGINKSFAKSEITQKIFEIPQSEENKFLEDIYKTETNTLKIKNLDKKVSEQNYIDKEIVETKTLDKSNEQYIKNQFGETKEFKDEEYEGVLSISDIKVENIKNGYHEKIDEKVLEFSNYSDNDLNNVEKELDINNTKYYLINVEWEVENTQTIDNENIPITYKGKKIYQTIQKIANPDTYEVTVTYFGTVKKINTIYDYTIFYEKEIPEEEITEEKESNIIPIIVVSGIGLTAILILLLNSKNTYIYAKNDKGFKLIKREKISDKNLSIDITNCKKSNESIYAIKINQTTFKKFKGRTISVVKGNKKKDIVLWNSYYEFKL